MIAKFGKEKGIGIITNQVEKYKKTGAYKILSKEEVSKVFLQPHHFIRTSLIENARSKSTPLRTILDPSSYVEECQSSFNANLLTLPKNKLTVASYY